MRKKTITVNDTFQKGYERAGYTPKVGAEAVERLYGIYARYETNVENRLLRAMRELRELRNGRKIT